VHIAEKNIEGRRYYYLQHSYRAKSSEGGSGKVKTSSTYLGTAENVLGRLNQTKRPVEVEQKEFGLIAALLTVSTDLGLAQMLQESFCGFRNGLPHWLYFFLTIINRLHDATSKNQMANWASKTVLPYLWEFDARLLTSQNFWYATEAVISEAQLREARIAGEVLTEEKLAPLKEANPALFNDLFAGVDDAVFHKIAEELFTNIKARFGIPEPAVLYDTTNFFTYIDEPARSELAKIGHNKEGRHNLRQVGLALAVDKTYGVPFYYRVYRGNSHDSKVFAGVIDELIQKIKGQFEGVDDLVLILDKGNNSKQNFKQLSGKIRWVGSLDQSKYPEFFEKDISEYDGQYQDICFYATKKKILAMNCLVVSTYRPSLARKQLFTLHAGIAKLTNEIQSKWDAYKTPQKTVPAGINSMIKASRYGKFIRLHVHDNGYLTYEIVELERAIAQKKFGRNLLFTGDKDADASWVISNYQSKYKIEESFKLIKSTDLVRFRPIRHFTDTKIAAFSFCCIIALMLVRAMELLCAEAGMKMSPELIVEELADIKAVTMVYGLKDIHTEITKRSKVQQKLWDLFRLQEVADQLPYKA
jgi:transposase